MHNLVEDFFCGLVAKAKSRLQPMKNITTRDCLPAPKNTLLEGAGIKKALISNSKSLSDYSYFNGLLDHKDSLLELERCTN